MKRLVSLLALLALMSAILMGCSSTNQELPLEDITDGQDQDLSNPLIETEQEDGITTFYKFKANTVVHFDIDEDGVDEEIVYDSATGTLNITGYDPVSTDAVLAETEYFVIIKYVDWIGTEMNLIGIIDYGANPDTTTSFYSIIEPVGSKWFGFVGEVPGKLVAPSEYDHNDMDHFNSKAFARMGEGIDAPVRLTLLPHTTWYGRNIFTYYSTYALLIDNIDKFQRNYLTYMELTVERDIVVGEYGRSDHSQGEILKAGSKVVLTDTDDQEWIAMGTIGVELKDMVGGWVKAKYVTEDNFSGFPD